jgi:hypothetical protein
VEEEKDKLDEFNKKLVEDVAKHKALRKKAENDLLDKNVK